ncbi:MAG: porphobilinogen synthase [Firmicutes bacterium]|nr:porphobilinogen synthase [Bacillota bacterium]
MTMFPVQRPRRLRENAALRFLVTETRLEPRNLVLPLFLVHGEGQRQPVPSLPGVNRHSLDTAGEVVAGAVDAGVRAVILFGIPAAKDERGTEASDPLGIVQEGVRRLKEDFPELLVITDVCLCQYTGSGHCGLLRDGRIDNDASIVRLAEVAVSHAQAGADVVAPSDMMDGRVAAIRAGLDREGYGMTPILSYAVKYASAFYGPFREAAGSEPQFGDRRGYQLNPANFRESMREAELDLQEGADILMVKPALPYLDILRSLRERFDLPLAAYQVSGEYAMLKAAAGRGWLEERPAVLEALTAIKRAGADLILTYYAVEAARWLTEG